MIAGNKRSFIHFTSEYLEDIHDMRYACDMVKARSLRKDWMLGFLGFMGFRGINGALNGDWVEAFWLAWFTWFTYFIPLKK